MEFTYNDNRVRVSFIYNSQGKDFYGKKEEFWGKEALRNIKQNRVLTYCQIAVKPANSQKADWKGLAAGFSMRNPHDQFSKAVGRKLSLQATTSQLEDRRLRQLIWDEYEKQHRDGRNFTK